MSQPYDVVGNAARIARSRAERRRELARPPGSIGMADRQPDLAWQRPVDRHLRALGAELEDALAASKRHDWASLLEAVRMIQGREGSRARRSNAGSGRPRPGTTCPRWCARSGRLGC
jgi:hypothetical protein